jgi:hypothetical protein
MPILSNELYFLMKELAQKEDCPVEIPCLWKESYFQSNSAGTQTWMLGLKKTIVRKFGFLLVNEWQTKSK